MTLVGKFEKLNQVDQSTKWSFKTTRINIWYALQNFIREIKEK